MTASVPCSRNIGLLFSVGVEEHTLFSFVVDTQYSLRPIMWVVVSGDGAGSFQCWGVLLLSHMAGQGPAVLAAGAGWVGCFYVFCFFYLVHPIFLS